MIRDDPLSGKLNWGGAEGTSLKVGVMAPWPPWHRPSWWWWEFNYKRRKSWCFCWTV